MDVLFEYLRKILYEPENASLDIDAVPAEQRELAEGLEYLASCMKEQRVFVKGLSKGDLETALPASDNPLTGELRSLHSSLTHLIWQAKQVAKGDYGQKLDFMGELSEVFNATTEKLADREAKLLREADVIRQQNRALEQGQTLLVTLTEQMTDWFIVAGKRARNIKYANHACQQFLDVSPETEPFLLEMLHGCPPLSGSGALHWETALSGRDTGSHEIIFEVTSQQIQWDGASAIFHMLRDVTHMREVESFVYKDPMTHLYNRRYGMEAISNLMEAGKQFESAFIDIDRLKFVNDTLGHEDGDIYIQDTAAAISRVREPKLICRIGGDEFLIISEDSTDLAQQLEKVRTIFVKESCAYNRSFSFGTVNSVNYSGDISDMIRDADIRMYQYKIRHKKQRSSHTKNKKTPIAK